MHTLILSFVLSVAVMAPADVVGAEDQPPVADESATPSLLERVQSLDLEKLDTETLNALASEVRQELVHARREAQALRYRFETENEDARQIIEEMTRIRRQLAELSKKYEDTLSEQEAFGVLSTKERDLREALIRITELVNKATDSSKQHD